MILQSRASEMAIMQKQQDDILSLLNKEHKRISVILDQLEYPSQKLLISQLQSAQQQIEFILDNIYGKTGVWKGRKVAVGGELESLMVDAMQKASQAGIDGKIKASIALLNDVNPELIPYLPSLFSGIREDVIQKLMVRPLSDDRIFSQRFWKLKDLNNNLISQTLSSGMLEGKSAFEIAQDLEKFLVLKGKGPAERSALFPTPTERKIMSRTMTLARTEINNAFTESQIECAKREPWNNGIKWHLSASHRVPDICDTYASQNLYDLGPGCYPPDKVPVRHPNCWCYLTDLLKSLDEVAHMLKSDMQIPEREVIRIKGTKPVEVVPEKPTLTPDEMAEKARINIVKESDKLKKSRWQLEDKSSQLFKKFGSAVQNGDNKLADKIDSEINEIGKQLADIKKKVDSVAERHLIVNKVPVELRSEILGDNKYVAEKREHLRELSRYIDPEILKGFRINIRHTAESRARYSTVNKTVYLSDKSKQSDMFHEVGHYIEEQNVFIKRDMQTFYKDRTKDDVLEKLTELTGNKSYPSHEVGKKDKFYDPYIGRYYKDGSTEVMSMGMMDMFEKPAELAQKDPEMFRLIFKAMRGLIND
jgi:hypothetical protein